MFAIAKLPTPILNTPDFEHIFGGSDGATLPLDDQGLLRAVETVALPGTKFALHEKYGPHVARITTHEYPGDKLFVDTRFLTKADAATPERAKKLPSTTQIIHALKSHLGASYVWGGSWMGIPQMLDFYPPAKPLTNTALTIWTFHGLDCSGILYLATNGCTPRNTSELVTFGKSLPIENKSPKEIAQLLKPLDLIVWKGHVLVLLNPEQTIESRRGFGVVTADLQDRLQEICSDREPANSWSAEKKCFVINRWI